MFCPRGFVLPEVIICGFIIRAGHRPAVPPCGLQIHRDIQTDAEDIKTCATPCVFPVGVDLVSARPVHSGLRQAKPLQRMVLHGPRGFAIPELIIADMLSARVTDPQSSPPVDYKSTGTNNPQGQMQVL